MSRKHKYLASVGLDGETPQQPQQQPTRKKKDSRSFFPSQNGDRVVAIHAGDVVIKNP